MTKEYMILKGDCLDRLKKLPDNSIDSVVTDPPYGLSKEPDIVEVLTKWMNGEPYDHGHNGFMGKCFHPNTDILTLRGWVSVKDVSKNDVVYTLNKDTNEIELSSVTNTFEYDFKGELISIAGRSVSQLVTPNHKVLVGNGKKEYKLQRADGRFNHHFYMKNQGNWTVPSKKTISFAGSERNACDLAYFIGLYLGDGYFVDRKSHKEKQNFAGFSVKKERKARSIREALSSLGFEFTENPPNESNEYYRFYLYDKDLLHELRKFGRSYDKHIPDYFFGESKEILRELYRGLMETDGTVQGNKNQEVFYTTSPRLADDFQRLCFLIGKSATKSIVKKSEPHHKDTFVLSVISEGKDFYLEKDKNISRIPYDGKVYCIEAERNHILMTRFDGKPVWSGNSWDSFVPHPDIWREVYRVLKPGGHALVFAGTRTQDLMTISLRLAGFEVRDVIEFLYMSGFPKGHNVSKTFESRGNSELAERYKGFNTSLKPAHEPIIVVRKPLEGTVCDNVERWGTGAINIDLCRIGEDEIKTYGGGGVTGTSYNWSNTDRRAVNELHIGRFPANCITLDDDAFYSKYFNISPPELSKKVSKRDRNSDWLGRQIDGDLVKIRSDLTESELEYVMSELERLSIQPVHIRS